MTNRQLRRSIRTPGIRVVLGLGALGGLAVPHAFRLRDSIKARLRETELDERGFWKAVGNDVLDLGDWREYVKPGQHDHSVLVGPVKLDGYTHPTYYCGRCDHRHQKTSKVGMAHVDYQEHHVDDGPFHVEMLRELKDVSQTVATINYILSHATKVEGSGDHMAAAFGSMHHFDPWDPEQCHPEVLQDIEDAVTRAMNGFTLAAHEVVDGDVDDDWRPVAALHQDMKDEEYVDSLDPSTFAFFMMLLLSMLNPHSDTAVGPDGESTGLIPSYLPWADAVAAAPPCIDLIEMTKISEEADP